MSPLDQPHDDATMSFGDHLEELRKRVILAAAPAIPLAVILFFFSDLFIRVLVVPLREVLVDAELPPQLQALAPPEVLLVRLKLSLILAAVLLAPWILWQAWLFIRPGLYGHERRFVRFLAPGSAVLTLAGIALLYFAMLPLTLQVLVRVGSDLDLGMGAPTVDQRARSLLNATPTIDVLADDPDDPSPGRIYLLVPEMELRAIVVDADGRPETVVVRRRERAAITQDYRLSTYVSFVLLLLIGIVIAFQMPLVIVLAGWIGLVTPQWLAENRKYALFGCGVASALLTPADIVSMLVLLLPLYGLYELGILLLRIAPATAVAEGGVRWRLGASDKEAAASRQTIEPVQPEGSLSRSADPADPADERSSESAD